MTIDFPQGESPIIKVIGVGGGGSNAVNHMYAQGIIGVDFAICNTDHQAMELSKVPTKMQLGPNLTEGRGAGSKPNVGKLACEESIEEVRKYLNNNCRMLFVTAGMGGGTGTGAAPIIAKTAREMGILTVGIVTLPFTFEGRRRAANGMDGLNDLKENVDTLIVVSNDKLRQIHGNLNLSEAFAKADNILTTAARGIAEIITVPGYVNVDFEDVNTVMRDSGVAIMGTATAEGDDRARQAVDQALHSPLLEDNDIQGARHILLNITSGTREVTMDEIFEITEFVQEEAGYGTDLIWGNCYDESLGDKLSVTVIATGFGEKKNVFTASGADRKVVHLDEADRKDQPQSQPRVSLEDITGEKDPVGYTKNNAGSLTYEFEDLDEAKIRLRARSNTPVPPRAREERSFTNSYLQNEEEARREAQRRELEARDQERRAALRNRTELPKLSNPKVVNELESQPAYLRRNIQLDNVAPSDQQEMSRWSITDDEEMPLRRGNRYLHDNVD
ncbi:cell division protein FtsZ [Neolewinella lacunae]|uniref:Cell division protein FtsZ n=1 Tax=Neolewinella lacunae TaxID=1517758 RepID=A0A923PPV0_9BACT|nr:cell division protein FtsZ [Neolewinella lacunae]MBC6994522.1 cell division protein FtsZ [Neolewinella lacunae]MDN3634215.1 cell division protein FtsZ [Neolewinella lacunae]